MQDELEAPPWDEKPGLTSLLKSERLKEKRKERRKEEKKERRKEGKKERRKEGKKERRKEGGSGEGRRKKRRKQEKQKKKSGTTSPHKRRRTLRYTFSANRKVLGEQEGCLSCQGQNHKIEGISS